MRTTMTGAAALAAVVMVAACAQDLSGPQTEELVIAPEVEAIARDVANTTATTHEHWVARLLAALRHTDNAAAQACLAEARRLREAARLALAAGNRVLARELLRDSWLQVLCAVVEVFPNAAERTGMAVDNALERIDAFLGDRDAPRIRAILEHVTDLRARARSELAEGHEVTALDLNLRALWILHRLRDHIRVGRDEHDGVARDEMESVALDG